MSDIFSAAAEAAANLEARERPPEPKRWINGDIVGASPLKDATGHEPDLARVRSGDYTYYAGSRDSILAARANEMEAARKSDEARMDAEHRVVELARVKRQRDRRAAEDAARAEREQAALDASERRRWGLE